MKRPALFLATALLLLIAAMALKGQLLGLPDVRGAGADGFDTSRALARLERVLSPEQPHPVDSLANDEVRARLLSELRAIGLRPEVTDDFACNGKGRGMSCARVRNVIVTVGPAKGKHVLLVSHYDSTPVGPGAADDGIGMAAMMEAAALLSQRKLRRPVTFLFNEGEEAGLLGARAFLQRHPIAGRVDALVNLEARGVSGPALMFETSRPNAPAIAHYQRSAERPAANSLSTDFYRIVPNSTDVAVFEERDWTVLNFAIIGNETRYHSPGDTLAALDPRSLQHMGDQALALTSSLANHQTQAAGTSIYADLLGRTLIVLPLELGYWLLATLVAAVSWFALRRRVGLGHAAAAIAAALVGSAAIAFLCQKLIGLFRSGEYWRAYPGIISVAEALSALLASVAALLWIARGAGTRQLRLAYWLLFLLIGAVLSAIAPGALIFFLAPPAAMALGLVLGHWIRRAERAAALAAFLLLFLTLAPVLALIEMLLDHDAGWLFAPVAALIMLPALIELQGTARGFSRSHLLGAVAGAAFVGWVAVAVAPAYSEDRKQQFGIEYVRNLSNRSTWWMIANDQAALPEKLDRYDFRFGAEVPWSTRRRWAAPAPGEPVQPPTLELVRAQKNRTGRRFVFRLRTRGASDISIEAPSEAGLLAFRVGPWQRRFEGTPPRNGYRLRCRGRSCDGLVFEVVAGPRPVELTVVGTRSGLPPAAAPILAARPALASPQYTPDSTITLSRLRL